jgi:hypothetical protein
MSEKKYEDLFKQLLNEEEFELFQKILENNGSVGED